MPGTIFRKFLALIVVVLLSPLAVGAFEVGPIPGLTTSWHQAPDSASIPLYSTSTLTFRRQVPPGASITWFGATEVSRDGSLSIAELSLAGVGPHVVGTRIVLPSGAELEESVQLEVLPISSEQISISPIQASVHPIELDAENLNASTFEYFQGLSIAGLRQLSERWYRTSTNRAVELRIDVAPPAFASLMEWRIPGRPARLGSSTSVAHTYPHIQQIEVGPLDDPEAIILETYSVEITSHTSDLDTIDEGVPVTFTAITNPPGLEDEITWLASTKYGWCEPVMGQGPQFTVRFGETFGPDGQWMGVKADQARLDKDEKNPPQPAIFSALGREITGGEAIALVNAYFADPTPVNLFCCGAASCSCDGLFDCFGMALSNACVDQPGLGGDIQDGFCEKVPDEPCSNGNCTCP